MVKVQKGRPVNKKKTKSIPSKTKRKSKHQQDNEEVDDVMAWGKSKQNYYQDEEDQYSEASEEQDEAKQIYDNQFNNLNEEQFYDLPEDQDQQAEVSQREDEEEDVINDEYVREQIIWATGLAKLFQTVEDEKAQFRKKVYDSYLLILMTLKQFKIPYVDQHPLVSNLPILKKALQHFQSEIPKLQKKLEQECEKMPEQAIGQQLVSDQHENEQEDFNQQYDNFMDQMDEEEDNISYENSPQQTKSKSVSKHETKNVKQGLQIYEKIKTQKQSERRQKKMENKKHRLQSRPKQAFKLVNQNEARLANEKILKNKGLMKRRQKGDGNSRTKLRGKYEKALIRRRAKGIVGVKQNPGRFYAGQDKVLYGKIASTKIK